MRRSLSLSLPTLLLFGATMFLSAFLLFWWIGAGLGVGVGMAAAAIKGAAGSSDPPTWAALYPFFGAGVGAIVGRFWKKKHKKHELVYSI